MQEINIEQEQGQRPTSMRCFSPESTPGVSTSVTSSSSWLGHAAASNLARNPFPYWLSPCACKPRSAHE